MLALAFDTETTGLVSRGMTISDPRYPEVVQFAAKLVRLDLGEVSRVYHDVEFIVKPNGKVPEQAAGIHGLDDELVKEFGITRGTLVAVWEQMASKANIVIGHNVNFDLGLMKALYFRLEREWVQPPEVFCTMLSMVDVCKLPGRYGYKWPKLQEAYKFLFGEEFKGAHGARADLDATLRIYLKLQEMGICPSGKA